MKKLMLFFLITPGLLLAQGSFNEADFKAQNSRYIKNPVAFIQNETTPNFIYTGTDGKVYDKAGTINIYGVLEEISREYSDTKVYQNGPNAVVSSLLHHEILIKPTKEKRIENEVLTASMVYTKGKWMLQSATHTIAPTDISNETAAIKKVIKDETDGYYEGNLDKATAQWAADRNNNEYQNLYISTFVGKPYAKGADHVKLLEVAKKMAKKQDVNVDETDFEIRHTSHMAWATYNQKVTKADGSLLQNQRQTRILEKINGDWKIVFVSGVDVK